MKRFMLLLVTAALGLSLMVSVQGCGSKSPVGPKSDLMSDPTYVAGVLMDNSISQEQMKSLLEKPASFQLDVARNIAIKQGKNAAESEAMVAELASSEPMASAIKSNMSPATLASCNQIIEYKTVVRDPVWAYTYRSYNDPSRGTEYLYSYNPWWSVSPDNIRWASTDGQVTWALMVCYGGNIAGYNLCGKPFQFETGNKGTWWAGGADRIFHSMYAHHL